MKPEEIPRNVNSNFMLSLISHLGLGIQTNINYSLDLNLIRSRNSFKGISRMQSKRKMNQEEFETLVFVCEILAFLENQTRLTENNVEHFSLSISNQFVK